MNTNQSAPLIELQNICRHFLFSYGNLFRKHLATDICSVDSDVPAGAQSRGDESSYGTALRIMRA